MPSKTNQTWQLKLSAEQIEFAKFKAGETFGAPYAAWYIGALLDEEMKRDPCWEERHAAESKPEKKAKKKQG
jgi:hypothetical protein